MSPLLHGIIQTGKNSAENERASKDLFRRELCEAFALITNALRLSRLALELETLPEENPTVPVSIVVPQPWPKEFKDQLAAPRGLLLSTDHLWTMEEVGASFKSCRRFKETIQANLGLPTDLGVLAVLETKDEVLFHRPQAVGA